MFSKLKAEVKRELPGYMFASLTLWLTRIITNFDGTYKPVFWLLGIAVTGIALFAIMSTIIGTVKLMWFLIKGAPRGNTAL